MKRRKNNTIPFILVMIFASGCNPSTSSRHQPSSARADTIITKPIAPAFSTKRGAGDTLALKENIAPPGLLSDEKPRATARVLSEADKRYIDWIIPDYPDVILFHEGSAETLNYMQQVYGYLRSKNASVTKKAITQKHEDKVRDKRLYIDDVGENWYEVFVFDEWK